MAREGRRGVTNSTNSGDEKTAGELQFVGRRGKYPAISAGWERNELEASEELMSDSSRSLRPRRLLYGG